MKIAGLSLLFRFILDIGYILYINPAFSYQGFLLHVDPFPLIESYLVTFVCSLIVNHKKVTNASFLLTLFHTTMLIPLTSLYGLSSVSRWAFYYQVVGFLIVAIIGRDKSNTRIVGWKFNSVIGENALLVMVLLSVLHIVTSIGIGNTNFDLRLVYEFRKTANEAVYNGIWGYLVNWCTKIFNVFLIGISIYKKRWLSTILFISLQVILFGFLSHKSVLLAPLLVFGMILLFKIPHPIEFIYLGQSLGIAFLFVLKYVTGSTLFLSLILRRYYFVPALLNFTYYDFFSVNPKVRLSNSILSWAFEYPYDGTGTARVIGAYLGSPTMSANTGFLATGFMHFGFLGVISFSCVVGLLIKLTSLLQDRSVPIWVQMSIVITPFMALVRGSDLFTSLITHGFAVSLLVLYVIRITPNRINGGLFVKLHS